MKWAVPLEPIADELGLEAADRVEARALAEPATSGKGLFDVSGPVAKRWP